jgi:hypothetical protein
MGHSDGEHELEGDGLSAEDSSWSDGGWSEDDDEVGEVFLPLSLDFFFAVLFLNRFWGFCVGCRNRCLSRAPAPAPAPAPIPTRQRQRKRATLRRMR